MNEKPAADDSQMNAVDSPCSTPIACNARSGGAPEKRCSILRRNVVSTNGSTGKRASLLRRSIVTWALRGKRASELSNSDTEHQPSASSPFWSRLVNNKEIWRDVDRADELVEAPITFKSYCDYLRAEIKIAWKTKWKTFRSHPRIAIATAVCLIALISISVGITYSFAKTYENSKKTVADEFALKAGNWFRQELRRAIFPLFALGEFVRDTPSFLSLSSLIGKGGEPGSAPYINATVINHRNVSGICDNSTVMTEFNRIAKSIKDDANLGGALVSLNLSPYDVACLFYPLNNTEDFKSPLYLDNSGAVGQDLLKDPTRRAIMLKTHETQSYTVAGPLSLHQCTNCPPVVRNAFIARLRVDMPAGMGYNINTGEANYSSWGFVAAVINWQRLLDRSRIYERFENQGMQFELRKTDRIFNATTNNYLEKTSVFAQSAGAYSIGPGNYLNVSLPDATSNNWTLSVAYDDGFHSPWFGWATAMSVIFSLVLSIVLMVILLEKQEHKNLLREMLPSKALKKFQRGGIVVKKYKMFTIFFSDIVGFTSMAAKMTPIDVMKMLNSFYSEVDKLADKHKVYKIKTIGDAYMAVGGLSCPDKCSVSEGALRVALFALDLMELVKNFRTEGGLEIVIRAGIHSGPVVAGVIERKRPQYTIFGDAVNVASCMESSSKAMKIQCSNATYHLLRQTPKYNVSLKERGHVEVNDLGRVHTWFIEGAREYIE